MLRFNWNHTRQNSINSIPAIQRSKFFGEASLGEGHIYKSANKYCDKHAYTLGGTFNLENIILYLYMRDQSFNTPPVSLMVQSLMVHFKDCPLGFYICA